MWLDVLNFVQLHRRPVSRHVTGLGQTLLLYCSEEPQSTPFTQSGAVTPQSFHSIFKLGVGPIPYFYANALRLPLTARRQNKASSSEVQPSVFQINKPVGTSGAAHLEEKTRSRRDVLPAGL